MALNFTVSYTFSPSTTISSSQVNTNTNDVAAVFQGLEAETKSLAKLKVDIDPTIALEVATKQYVDHYSTWRRPNLVYGSATTVAVESGLDGTSGNIPILFPDGTVRTETSTTRTTFVITRNAVLVTSGAQSGLTGATSEATNTWYALYAVKVTDSSTLWVTVGSTVIPTQGNYATLNTAYGANGWVYLGMIVNGDNAGATGDIVSFVMSGNETYFSNLCSFTTLAMNGILMAATGGATSLTYTYAAGTTAATIPGHLKLGTYAAGQVWEADGNGFRILNAAGNINYGLMLQGDVSLPVMFTTFRSLAAGLQVSDYSTGSATTYDIGLQSFIDPVLGVGSNPLL